MHPSGATACQRDRHRTSRPARLGLMAASVVVVLAAMPGAAAAADPTPAPSTPPQRSSGSAGVLAPAAVPPRGTPTATLAPLPSSARAPTSALVYRESAMVKQFTNYWCVPASTQSMVNLILGTSDRSRATQERYYAGTRAHNRYTYQTKGNDPQGWAWALDHYTGGVTDYRDRAFTNKDAALAAIAEAIDRTGDPVGALVHEGTHAWVVLGYKAERDPADPTKRRLLGFYVSGPLGSPSDPWPIKYLSISSFRSHFTRYHEWQFDVVWEDRWVIVSQ